MGICSSKRNQEKSKSEIKSSRQEIYLGSSIGQQGSTLKKTVSSSQPVEEKGRLQQRKTRIEKKRKLQIDNVQEQEQENLENIKKIDKIKTKTDELLILDTFKKHCLFNQLQRDQQKVLMNQMFYCTITSKNYLFKQNDPANTYFLIEKGACEVIVNNQVKKLLTKGDFFGELALLYNSPRTASVFATENSSFWAIDRKEFCKIIEKIQQEHYEQNRQFLDKIQFFCIFFIIIMAFLTNQQKDNIAHALINVNFSKNDIIVNEGDMATSFFIIKTGKVVVLKGDQQLRILEDEDSFGEQALFTQSVRGATVKAMSDEVNCLALGRDDMTRILGDQIQNIMYHNTIKWAFQAHMKLKYLTDVQIEKILLQVSYLKIEKGNTFKYIGDSIFILLQGKLSFRGQEFKKGYLNDALLQSKRKALQKTLIAVEDSILAEITSKQLQQCIGGEFEQVILRNKKQSATYKNLNKLKNADLSHLKLEELYFIKKLGQGQFGKVFLVHEPLEKNLYSLKSISKSQVVEQNICRHLQQEFECMKQVDFPFIMSFFRSFRDSNYIYFMLEFINGMELFDVIREIGMLNAITSQFYIGQIILGIEYLHNLNISYRDLKPENIMVGSDGYIKLIDMGTAKDLSKQGQRTYTVIGTPHYMAPEISQGKDLRIHLQH